MPNNVKFHVEHRVVAFLSNMASYSEKHLLKTIWRRRRPDFRGAEELSFFQKFCVKNVLLVTFLRTRVPIDQHPLKIVSLNAMIVWNAFRHQHL